MQILKFGQRLSTKAGLGHSVRTGIVRPCLPHAPAAKQSAAQIRTQHNDYGPHKEYFQTPGREPKPDLTPYIRDASRPQPQPQPQPSSSPSQSSNTSNPPDQPAPQRPRGWQRIPRIIRSLIWVIVFFDIGAALATGLITWEYLSPPFEPGSPEEQELVEGILEALETHPMVEDLKEKQWVEVDAFKLDLQHGVKGRSLVHQVLGGNNPQGIFMKVFHHPTTEFTMMVFFLGFGIEGWPDVVHGGTISMLLQEGLSKHVAYYYSDCLTAPDHSTKIDFRQPCKPGEIYGVLVPPAGRGHVSVGNLQLTQLSMTSLLVKLEGAPVISSDYNMVSGVQTLNVGVPSAKGVDPAYATCQAEIKIIPKELQHGSQIFEAGGRHDEGFGKALDILKRRPEFKDTQSTSSLGKKDGD